MNKLISIILPTYNGAGRIQEALLSVLGQSYLHWELLVVDDGSTDNTEELVKDLPCNEKRIIYIKNESNLGIQQTLNKGLKEAKGEYIARIDDDDMWIDKDKLLKQVEFLEKNKDCVLVGTGLVAVNEEGKEIFRTFNPELDAIIRNKILSKTCFTHSSVMFRKALAMQLGGYSELSEVRHIEDYDLWLKMGTVGKLANLPIYGVRLLFREGSISSENKIAQLEKSVRLIRKFKSHYPNYLSSVVSLSVRTVAQKFLRLPPFRYFSASIYKMYKNL